jgi:hypothetical protein
MNSSHGFSVRNSESSYGFGEKEGEGSRVFLVFCGANEAEGLSVARRTLEWKSMSKTPIIKGRRLE